MKKVLTVSFGVFALSLAACSKGNEVKSPPTVSQKAKLRNVGIFNKPFHGEMDTSSSAIPVSPMLESLKNNHLDASSTKTIGEAFDSYKFSIKKEWQETPSPKGPSYIDYICWLDISPVSSAALKEGVVRRALDIKFVIHEDGETYIAMASRIDIKSDGMLYTTPIDPLDIKKIVKTIYENREITF